MFTISKLLEEVRLLVASEDVKTKERGVVIAEAELRDASASGGVISPAARFALESQINIANWYVRRGRACENARHAVRCMVASSQLRVTEDNVYQNCLFYAVKLSGLEGAVSEALETSSVDGLFNSTPSYFPGTARNGAVTNVRHVSYRWCPESGRIYIPNGGTVFKSVNEALGRGVLECSGLARFTGEMSNTFSSDGLEDIRLFEACDGTLRFLGPSRNYNEVARYDMVEGLYDAVRGETRVTRVLASPLDRMCEKNWAPVHRMSDGATDTFIYSWGPFRLLDFDTASITKTIETPSFFSQLRGSSGVIPFCGGYVAAVHSVKMLAPLKRKYLHWLVYLDASLSPKGVSPPFTFEDANTEYCLGISLDEDGGIISFFYSTFDHSSRIMRVPARTFMPSGALAIVTIV